jgi:5'-nucleotidase
MRILVTNDDGIEAPGLNVLQQLASELSDDVWVTAPETEQSGAAHSLTLHEPLRLRRLAERTYAVKGTPTDCVIMAVRHIMAEKRPDLVLSGVNRGQNTADDVTYSGTIAGAIEGSLLGVPSIALSLAYDYENPVKVKWETPMRHGAALIRRLLAAGWPPNVLMNVNFPDCEPDEVRGVAVTEQGVRSQDMLRIEDRLDTRGSPYYWLGFFKRNTPPAEGSDLWAIGERLISVTPLSLDLTHRETCGTLRTSLNGIGAARTP